MLIIYWKKALQFHFLTLNEKFTNYITIYFNLLKQFNF